jgi:hypothetical protein
VPAPTPARWPAPDVWGRRAEVGASPRADVPAAR